MECPNDWRYVSSHLLVTISTSCRRIQTNSNNAAMNSLYSAGGLMGCLSVGWLADRLGRKRSIQLICVLCLVASIFTTASVNIGMFLAGRALQGVSSGMIDSICPLYQSEVSPAHARGRMVGMHAFFLVLGYVSCSNIGKLKSLANPKCCTGWGKLGWFGLLL